MPHFKLKLPKATQTTLYQEIQHHVKAWGLRLTPEQYCQYSLKGSLPSGEGFQLKQYSNGTFYVDAASELALQHIAQTLKLPYSAEASIQEGNDTPPATETTLRSTIRQGEHGLPAGGWYPCFGCDESGKGDYFGPLVSATVFLTSAQAKALHALGVCDSKTLTEARIQHLGKAIADTVGMEAIGVVELMPEQYNQLYNEYTQQKKNLNHLLATLHSKGVEGVLKRESIQQILDTSQAPQGGAFIIVDQFGNERYLNTSFKAILTQGHTLHQQTKAEQFTSVAAASIIARYRFVLRMKQLSEQWHVRLPLGAGSQVPAMAKQLVRTHGSEVLSKVAKLHFKTTQQVLGGHSLL
jgi:ribonuclease HIII